jgi:subtilisin family serine protease
MSAPSELSAREASAGVSATDEYVVGVQNPSIFEQLKQKLDLSGESRIDLAGRYWIVKAPRDTNIRSFDGVTSFDQNAELSILGTVIPDDEFFPFQCGMQTINAPEGWDILSKSPDVDLALMDTGVDYNHPDLMTGGSKFWTIRAVGSMSLLDENGHGTHMAGILSGDESDAHGIVGVSWKYKSLTSYRCLDDEGHGKLKDGLQALLDAIAQHPRIIVFGWGTTVEIEAIKNEMRKATDILFVAAAGNSGRDIDTDEKTYPAAYGSELDNLISVMAIDCKAGGSSPVPSWFTNRGGTSVHIAAPGDGPDPYRIYSTALGGTHYKLAGTSMSAAFVAGAAALVLQQNSSLTPKQVRDKLMNTAAPLAANYKTYCVSGGYLDLYKALQ